MTSSPIRRDLSLSVNPSHSISFATRSNPSSAYSKSVQTRDTCRGNGRLDGPSRSFMSRHSFYSKACCSRVAQDFLGLFWMYNSISVVIFHFSWKLQSDVWGSVQAFRASHVTDGNFSRSSVTINGWLRDFLWSQASQVIQSYGSSNGSYGLFFLGAHFVWAFSLMFLFSGRGYWQELIESIVWAHQVLHVTPSILPRALSITQGRAVGVSHYLLGGIVTTWSFFLARVVPTS